MRSKLLALAAAGVVAGSFASIDAAHARDQIKIVGSSTVFPFSTAVAEKFGQKGDFKTPVVESTGSGGGLKLFCAGVGTEHPDITNASRAIKDKEIKKCKDNGVAPVTEIMIGFDGIVLANAKAGPSLSLTRQQIYQALAKEIMKDGKMVPNPYQKWSDIDPSLPDEKIEVLGPPPTSGTRDAFEELAVQKGCQKAGLDKKACKKVEVREDGPYVEAGENDNLIVSKLEANPKAVGVFGFSFLDQNAYKMRGAKVDGVEPTFENIADGAYPVSRSLFFYVKAQHVGVVPGIKEYIAEFVSDAASGDEGYLVDKGLIPLPRNSRGDKMMKSVVQ